MKLQIRVMVVLSVILALCAVSNLYAQPQQGQQELILTAGLDRQIGSGVGNFNGDITYGHFIDDSFQLGVRQGMSYTFSDDTQDFWRATTVPFVDYHCEGFGRDNQVVPVLGGFVGAVWNDEDFTGTVGPQAGLKIYVDDSAFFLTRYRYEWFFEDLDDVNETIDSAHVVTAGFGYTW